MSCENVSKVSELCMLAYLVLVRFILQLNALLITNTIVRFRCHN